MITSTTRATSLQLTSDKWLALAYSKIPKNQVHFNKATFKVKVAKSAGPIVYKLDKKEKINSFQVKAKLTGNKKSEKTDFDEDSVLRFGLVGVGEKTLSGVKKLFAADWVKKLFSLAPEGTGLDKIYFYNITNRPELVGKKRQHPKSDLIVETISKNITSDGEFDLNVDLENTIESVAIWLSIDGDDTASEFELEIMQIVLNN